MLRASSPTQPTNVSAIMRSPVFPHFTESIALVGSPTQFDRYSRNNIREKVGL
jgi:hypothetical protein